MSLIIGMPVIRVTATDADDPSYGNSARVVYSVVKGQPYFSVDRHTGKTDTKILHFYVKNNNNKKTGQ